MGYTPRICRESLRDFCEVILPREISVRVRMELNPDAISSVVHPTAAFVENLVTSSASDTPLGESQIPWENSELNPKNRIDSLEEVSNPRWRIDGSTGMGTQYYTIPLFFANLNPIRIDTFIPEPSTMPRRMREILNLDTAFHYKDSRVTRLGISRHILRTLEHWTSSIQDLEEIYNNLPFGSRIVFQSVERDVRKIKIRIVPTHYLERQLMSWTSLQKLWNIPGYTWPELVDISRVQLVHQLYDSVSLVRLPGPRGPQTMVLKALTSDPKNIYHELKFLLTLPPQANILCRPRQLVVKKCCFGGKTAVVGFVTEYHSQGTLRDILPRRAISGTLLIADQTKWALQLTAALIHMWTCGRFYSDLRLDNILLSGTDNLIIVDFEQRGVWCEFAAPEVNYLDYFRMLAYDSTIPEAVCDRYNGLLRRYFPGLEATHGAEYLNPEYGHSIPWLCLSRIEQQSAEVYMLGRVLWCMFEGLSNPEAAVWQSYRLESDLQFPNYRDTPLELRSLINKCTRGRKDVKESNKTGVMRRGNRLVLRDGDGTETAEQVQSEATRWWKKELDEAEIFFREREARMTEHLKGDFFDRPTLREVFNTLESFRNTME